MRRNAGVILEPVIWVFFLGLGLLLVVPQAKLLWAHQPLVWWRWVCLVVGGFFLLIPILGVLEALLDMVRKPR